MLYYERHVNESLHAPLWLVRLVGVLLTFLAGSSLSGIMLARFATHLPQGAGGILGSSIAVQLLPELNLTGTLFVLWITFLIGWTLFAGVSWLKALWVLVISSGQLIRVLSHYASYLLTAFKQKFKQWLQQRANNKIEREKVTPVKSSVLSKPDHWQQENTRATPLAIEPETYSPELEKPNIDRSSTAPLTDHVSDTIAQNQIESVSASQHPFSGQVPALTVLDKAIASQNQVSRESLQQTATLVEQKLADFGITVQVVEICPGPIVTRYELQMAPGTKVSKLTGLAKDLARSLATHSVRIVEVIPGKPFVGLELPNASREMVRLQEVLSDESFVNRSDPLLMGLGKDIAGKPQVVNLAKMPHLLVAGTTGSGKSVGVNAMLLSLLLKCTPDHLRLIMIDPKMLELSIYEGIPHLLTPVVTDMKEAANALRWCVREMDRRYQIMASAGVRNIAGMNKKIEQAHAAGTPCKDPLWLQTHPGMEDQAPDLEPLPYIVVIVDEFADMMMVVGKKVEELIARLAQKARAAGIHLILATQRPSVDVITGLIKANIPTRIAFQVSSRIDSRTILDQQGAEQLLGHGDMLYLPPGTSIPVRIHGAFVADNEVHAVVAAWKQQGEPNYLEEITHTESTADEEREQGGEQDPLYDEALKIVLETQRASISSIQRRLKIGYNRAARLIEEMEAAGVVSAMQNNGLREILVSKP